ncbi:MAG: preprotein translocase subunit SecG [Verrucomicrobiota bacterium]
MMTLITGLLTVLMILDCLLLILLVLVQLPKKEAGAGMAFGGAATDALFGAGSGNALTKITKYIAGAFFVLALSLGLIMGRSVKPEGAAVEEALKRQGAAKPVSTAPATLPATKAPAEVPMLLTNQIVPAANLPAPSAK